MPEDGSIFDVAAGRLQRATGCASAALSLRDGALRLDRLHQEGSAKLFLPRVYRAAPELVFLNTAGGLTGGDRLAFRIDLGPGAHAVGTTQTAERAYASLAGRAEMDVGLTLGAGATLHWLPQETILFDSSTLARRTRAEIGPGAGLILCEMVVLGRAAMGETVARLGLDDLREVRRCGVPVLVEPLRLTASTLAAGPATLGGARAFVTVALVAEGAEDALAAVRGALTDDVEIAASAWNGRLVVRAAGHDLRPVKRAVARVLNVLRGAPLPRVWQM
jgi:urease accessory protein